MSVEYLLIIMIDLFGLELLTENPEEINGYLRSYYSHSLVTSRGQQIEDALSILSFVTVINEWI